jgi:hypothetical protein
MNTIPLATTRNLKQNLARLTFQGQCNVGPYAC